MLRLLARFLGMVLSGCMQKSNKKIRNATECKSGNITFKSQLEKSIYNTLQQLGFDVKYEPETHMLWDSFTPITPFYDKESDAQHTKRVNEGAKVKSRLLVPKTGKIIGIRYTPDFYFKYKDLDVYIEAKGIENDVFYIKKKMFRKYLDGKYTNNKQHSIFFEIYTKAQLLQAVEIIKEYAESLQRDKQENKLSSS